jgi:hypothetical protein
MTKKTYLSGGEGSVSRRALLGGSALGLALVAANPATLAAAAPSAAPTVVADPALFAGIDPTGASDSSNGLQAALDSVPEGGTLVVPTGRYRVSTTLWVKGGRSLCLSAYGATLVQTSARSILSIGTEYTEVLAVARVSEVTPSGSSPVTQLELPASHSWRAGDIVKVVADDPIPGGRPGTDGRESRIGEFAAIDFTTSTTIRLAGLLRDSYQTNIRVARVPAMTFHLKGGTFTTADERLGTSNNAVIVLSALREPTVEDTVISNIGGTGLQLISCLGYAVSKIQVSNAPDSPSTNQYGYAVLDNASAHGVVSGGLFTRVRHGYTDDTDRIAAGSNPLHYGSTFGTTVMDCAAIMTTNSGFDTHHCSRHVSFLNCTTTSGTDRGQGHFGFQLRGLNHSIVGCDAIGTGGGVQVLNETAGGDSTGHVIDGLRVQDTRGFAVRVALRPAGHPSAGIRQDSVSLSASGVIARNTWGLVSAYNAVVVMDNSRYVAPRGAGDRDIPCTYVNNSLLSLRQTELDFTLNEQGAVRVFSAGSANGSTPGLQETEVEGVVVRATPAVVARTWAAADGPAHILRGSGLRFTTPFRSMPGDTLHPRTLISWSADWTPGAEEGRLSSASFVMGITNANALVTNLNRSADRSVFVAIKISQDQNAPVFPVGRVLGQSVHFVNRGTARWTVFHGPSMRTRLFSGTKKVISPDQQILLVWDGTVWRQAAI